MGFSDLYISHFSFISITTLIPGIFSKIFIILSSAKFAIGALLTAEFARLSLSHTSPEKISERFVPISMGLAGSYGAVAATTLTSTGNTSIIGDCGTCPGTAITGFPPGKCTGITSAGGTAGCNAQAACLTAYNDASAAGPTIPLAALDLGGLTLGPGVYEFPTEAASLTGALTLDGLLDPEGLFIFLIHTTFKTAVGSQVLLINGSQACNVYFIVGSSATVGAASALQGNLLAYTSVSPPV